jgi:hypothetical protein
MWKTVEAKVIPTIVGATGSLSRSFQKYLDDIPDKQSSVKPQKTGKFRLSGMTQDSRSPGHDLNPGPPEYEAKVLTMHLILN